MCFERPPLPLSGPGFYSMTGSHVKRAQALGTGSSGFKSSSASNQLVGLLQGAQALWPSVFLAIKWDAHPHLAGRLWELEVPRHMVGFSMGSLRVWTQRCPLRPWDPSDITRKEWEGACLGSYPTLGTTLFLLSSRKMRCFPPGRVHAGGFCCSREHLKR